MKRKLIFELDTDRGELKISDENREIVHWKNLGLIEIEGFEAAFNLGASALLNKNGRKWCMLPGRHAHAICSF